MAWIINNLATIIVGAIVALIVAMVIVKMVNDKKKGKGCCGCDCANCTLCQKQSCSTASDFAQRTSD